MLNYIYGFLIAAVLVVLWDHFKKGKDVITSEYRFASRVVCYIDTTHGTFATFDDGDTWYKVSKFYYTRVTNLSLSGALEIAYERQLAKLISEERS